MSQTDAARTQIQVTGDSEYTITVGRGITQQVAAELGDRVNKVLIVHTPTVGRVADELRAMLQQNYEQVLLAEVPDAEAAKRVEVAAFCWQILGQADFTRTDAIIGLGGGAVTD
ncbi:MAG: 3-dehydroquinate synthase, partial [Leucobacter sp.]|nr:3-dehydroquinate synthase [Leucobacter sp.]